MAADDLAQGPKLTFRRTRISQLTLSLSTSPTRLPSSTLSRCYTQKEASSLFQL